MQLHKRATERLCDVIQIKVHMQCQAISHSSHLTGSCPIGLLSHCCQHDEDLLLCKTTHCLIPTITTHSNQPSPALAEQ